jgi:hypothetical protein
MVDINSRTEAIISNVAALRISQIQLPSKYCPSAANIHTVVQNISGRHCIQPAMQSSRLLEHPLQHSPTCSSDIMILVMHGPAPLT